MGTIGYLIYSVSNSFSGFLAAEIILGIGGSFISGADSAMLFDSLAATKRQHQYLQFEGRITSLGNFAETAGDGIPTLAVEYLKGDAMDTGAMVRGVEDMQIEFGIDAGEDDTPDQYKDTPTAGDLERVVSARIYLLLRSEIELPDYTNTKIYTLGGKVLAAKNDGFMRKVYSTTVQMRNAIPPGA